MSRHGRLEIVWAGDERVFRMGIDELLALEDACDAGCYEIYMRLVRGSWRLRDATEPIRLGLLGGGADPKVVKRLVETHVVAGRLTEAALLAEAILAAALAGDLKDPKETGGETAPGSQPTTEDSPPPPSMETAPQSDSGPTRSDA